MNDALPTLSATPSMSCVCGAFLLKRLPLYVPLSAADFARVNPNTGTTPIFKTRRDAALTTAIYNRLPVLVDQSGASEIKAWPVRYSTMFHMTNDSGLFRTKKELEEKEGAYPIGLNRFKSASSEWVPLYVGRMIHQFDHRAASVEINKENVHNAAFSGGVTAEQKGDPNFVPTPQYWVKSNDIEFPTDADWGIAFRDIARATDARTMIAAAVPRVGLGNTAPLITMSPEMDRKGVALFLANLNSLVLDFVARQKAQSTHLNWYIVEQLPILPLDRYTKRKFGKKVAAEVIQEAVLELTYTANDMASFARDMGHVDGNGKVQPPYKWDETRRLHLRAKLDAIYFLLYGITNREDARYIYSTFPIVEREEVGSHGRYLSQELCLAWMNALAAGDPNAHIATLSLLPGSIVDRN